MGEGVLRGCYETMYNGVLPPSPTPSPPLHLENPIFVLLFFHFRATKFRDMVSVFLLKLFNVFFDENTKNYNFSFTFGFSSTRTKTKPGQVQWPAHNDVRTCFCHLHFHLRRYTVTISSSFRERKYSAQRFVFSVEFQRLEDLYGAMIAYQASEHTANMLSRGSLITLARVLGKA